MSQGQTAGQRAQGRRRRRHLRRAPLPRRRRAPVQVSAGAHAGQEDGQGDDLLPGALRLHARQLDPDPARPVGFRQVRQARRRLQRRGARLADPQDPADGRPAQHRPDRRGAPRQGDRLLGNLRRPRLPRRHDLRHRRLEGRHEGRHRTSSATSTTCARSSRTRTSSSASSRSRGRRPRGSRTSSSRRA